MLLLFAENGRDARIAFIPRVATAGKWSIRFVIHRWAGVPRVTPVRQRDATLEARGRVDGLVLIVVLALALAVTRNDGIQVKLTGGGG